MDTILHPLGMATKKLKWLRQPPQSAGFCLTAIPLGSQIIKGAASFSWAQSRHHATHWPCSILCPRFLKHPNSIGSDRVNLKWPQLDTVSINLPRPATMWLRPSSMGMGCSSNGGKRPAQRPDDWRGGLNLSQAKLVGIMSDICNIMLYNNML